MIIPFYSDIHNRSARFCRLPKSLSNPPVICTHKPHKQDHDHNPCPDNADQYHYFFRFHTLLLSARINVHPKSIVSLIIFRPFGSARRSVPRSIRSLPDDIIIITSGTISRNTNLLSGNEPAIAYPAIAFMHPVYLACQLRLKDSIPCRKIMRHEM